MRVGDQERQLAASALQEHFVAGRLTHAEFEDRVGQALAATDQAHLDTLFGDLPSLPSLVREQSLNTRRRRYRLTVDSLSGVLFAGYIGSLFLPIPEAWQTAMLGTWVASLFLDGAVRVSTKRRVKRDRGRVEGLSPEAQRSLGD